MDMTCTKCTLATLNLLRTILKHRQWTVELTCVMSAAIPADQQQSAQYANQVSS